ncbi:hypothetical protein CAPTEDRAFT_107275 [Capitella teleta]|uniref:Uncharacterized protein n=1 Tax=Capitella teleta TaxID=283909 RepID=R7V5R4_CAPTE|nr:hypothetical protein CAPTEDRAFT_107275 [Capitella teleta]|eukprot:ELU13817.1 hypothetical protein CAPTEDRAFT_107275 [Capitella teleta]
MELERAMEITRQKDGDHAMVTSELEECVRHRDQTISHLETELQNLQKGIDEMSRELEAKGKDVLRIRSEANAAARSLEDQVQKQFKSELNDLMDQHQNEAQQMLTEFTEAQEILKDKISELRILLEEAEDRYMNRESRAEDLEMIQNLQMAIREAQQQIQKLMDEKRHYQMELVNRETNFNKMFNGDPKVGVMNPLSYPTHKKAKGDKNGVRGSPSIHNRLDPLPGSPFHDGQFNTAKPLPPPSKKFIK